MAPAEPNADYYAVLEISNLDTIEVVTKSYRRLAKIRHPDKNLKDDSTAAFQLLTKLQNAYDTLSDPLKRRAYDIRWAGVKDTLRAQQESEKRRAEAAQAEQKRATEARAKKHEEDNIREELLRGLRVIKSRHESDIFELSRLIRKLVADLKRLQEQDDEEIRKERERNGWWAYLTTPIYGKVDETDEQKQTRETRRLDRLASKSIKGSDLAEKEAKLQRLQAALQSVNGKIEAEKKKMEEEKKRSEDEAKARMQRMQQEARDRAMQEMRDRMAKARKESAEKAAREAREAEAAQEAQERAQGAAAAAERRRMEAQSRAEAMRRAEEAARKAEKTRNQRSEAATKKGACRHDRYWPKVEGSQLCGQCHALQRRFAFQCPGCRMVACASCRQTLRGEKRKKRGGVRSDGRDRFAWGGDGYDDGSFY